MDKSTPAYGTPASAKPTKPRDPPMTDAQKKALTKHMEDPEQKAMDSKARKSHRSKMSVRMRKGMSVDKAHKDLTQS